MFKGLYEIEIRHAGATTSFKQRGKDVLQAYERAVEFYEDNSPVYQTRKALAYQVFIDGHFFLNHVPNKVPKAPSPC